METNSNQYQVKQVFDAEIEPLIRKIHGICEKNGLPFFAVFSVSKKDIEIEGEMKKNFDVIGSAFLPQEQAPVPMEIAYRIIRAGDDFEKVMQAMALKSFVMNAIAAAPTADKAASESEDVADSVKH